MLVPIISLFTLLTQGDAGKSAWNAKAAEGGNAGPEPTESSSSSSSSDKSSTTRRSQVISKAKAGGTSGDQRKKANPYIEFCKAQRPGVKQAHPGASPSELMQLLAQAWREHKS